MREHEVGYATMLKDGRNQRFEYLSITVEPGENLYDARARVQEHAEYGRWELAKSCILYGGRRRYLLRRRIIRVRASVEVLVS